MKNDLVYQLALTCIPHIGAVHAKALIDHFGDAASVFKAGKGQLEKIEGIGPMRANAIRQQADFNTAEQELIFIEKHHIHTFFLTDPGYPQRLQHCYDAPALLFYKGTVNLNASRILAIVGTRYPTTYGKQVLEKLLQDLAGTGIVIVSGLAYGIDAQAHQQALHHQLPTIGVLGHGLDTMYPAQHSALARQMLQQEGGLLTEFRTNTKPDKHNFPARNRIVAGMSDATIVIETAIKGGSMITAELANGYNKDVFAFPGKTTDDKSAGCNYLIKSHKAQLLTDAQDLLHLMGWEPITVKPTTTPELFPTLNEAEHKLVTILREKENIHIDELNIHSQLNGSAIAAALLNLELQGIVKSLPGKLYRLN